MFKVIFVIGLSLAAFSSHAQTFRCSCQQTFEDFMGNVSEVTVHVICPPQAEESELNCASDINHKTFDVACTNTTTKDQNITSINIDPDIKPVYGYTYCRLN